MKIFKWRIYPSSRIERVVKMMEGGEDDINMAKLLLLPPPKKEEEVEEIYPKYRIRVTADSLMIEDLESEESKWRQREHQFYYGDADRDKHLEKMKSTIDWFKNCDQKTREKKKFKEYTLNF